MLRHEGTKKCKRTQTSSTLKAKAHKGVLRQKNGAKSGKNNLPKRKELGLLL